MIKYYQRTIKDQKLKKLEHFLIGSLVHVVDPQEEEIKSLAKQFSLDVDILKDALDPYEAPRMEIKKDIAYIFARVPRHDEEMNNISTFPVMFAIGKNFFIIASQENTDFLLSAISRRKKYYTTQRTKLFIKMFSEIEDKYNYLLNNISRRINYFGLNSANIKDEDIIGFVKLEVILNEFISALLPVRHVLSSVISGKALGLYQNDRDLIEDLQLNNDQLIERSKSYLTNIVNIRQAQEVISTNRLNRVMKVLTASTVILALPTMITSLYGMNVDLPFVSGSGSFWGILTVITALTGTLLVILKKSKII